MKTAARFLILLMILVVFSPLSSNDVRASSHTASPMTSFSFKGFATEVSVVGEWNWSNPVPMTEQNGIWSAEVDLQEGLYCYKFIVDGEYIFDPMNPERSYCGDIENSLVRGEIILVPTSVLNFLLNLWLSRIILAHQEQPSVVRLLQSLEPSGMPNNSLGPTMSVDWKMGNIR